jgi:hypothetical protein
MPGGPKLHLAEHGPVTSPHSAPPSPHNRNDQELSNRVVQAYRQAIQRARAQHALSLELRAGLDLYELCAQDGRADHALHPAGSNPCTIHSRSRSARTHPRQRHHPRPDLTHVIVKTTSDIRPVHWTANTQPKSLKRALYLKSAPPMRNPLAYAYKRTPQNDVLGAVFPGSDSNLRSLGYEANGTRPTPLIKFCRVDLSIYRENRD